MTNSALAELTGLNNSRCGSVDHTGTQNRNRPPPPGIKNDICSKF